MSQLDHFPCKLPLGVTLNSGLLLGLPGGRVIGVHCHACSVAGNQTHGPVCAGQSSYWLSYNPKIMVLKHALNSIQASGAYTIQEDPISKRMFIFTHTHTHSLSASVLRSLITNQRGVVVDSFSCQAWKSTPYCASSLLYIRP